MMNRRSLFSFLLLIVSLCMLVSHTVAGERKEAGAHRNIETKSEGRIGTINSIDFENHQLVIDDLKFSFPPQQLQNA